MPFRIRVASVSFYIYAAISAAWGLGYYYLIGKSQIAWPLAGILIGVAVLYVWVGRNLHRGTTVMWIARVLGIIALLGGLSSLSNPTATNRPGILAFVIARIVIGLVITISLFMPRTAPTPPSPASGGGK
jgi:hypothetical protein